MPPNEARVPMCAEVHRDVTEVLPHVDFTESPFLSVYSTYTPNDSGMEKTELV